ncbi:aldehyde dehydrogenase family protein [Thalassotalea euphylliae]|uniref:Aldehyde dehydrogenase n=1 Tax=Thalassotalea euphylliae TaxID=1655234 RepID=A0A3E0TY60_9GAMM|nr:aldehyde dehydrogenase family protein [Thalassotalea euphylliae]REL29337.1 aldehyde dehydrogenase [Thalassotalea euphylliae]
MKLTSFDPSNQQALGEVEVATSEQIHEYIQSAKVYQKQWRQLPLAERVEIVYKAFMSLSPYSDELAVLLSKEMGKDIDRSTSEVRGAIFAGSHYAKEAGAALSPRNDGSNISYRALGVCAVISPWNYPLAMAVNLIVPALIAGNTVVFKPSEQTPLIAEQFIAHLNHHLPKNLITIVHGDGAVGEVLAGHQDIALVAFTGSQAVGKKIMKSAASSLKRLVMELGGNDPMIVLKDADLDAAARFAVASSFENAGQMCTSTERIYVEKAVAQCFIDRVVTIARYYQTGAWDEPNAHIGPIVSKKQLAKITEHMEDAREKGAHVLLGGDVKQGNFFNPTVLTNLSPNMLMEQEETFGPVVAIAEVDSVAEAIYRANDSDYGLGAVVFGREQVAEVANQLEAGMIGINKGAGGGGASPWVGAKQSGFGFHGGFDGHRQFAQVTVIS